MTLHCCVTDRERTLLERVEGKKKTKLIVMIIAAVINAIIIICHRRTIPSQ